MIKGKWAVALGMAVALFGFSQAQNKDKLDKEFERMLKTSFTNDPTVSWKLEQDEVQKICSRYPSQEAIPAKEVQRVMELSKKTIKYPDWGVYLGNIENGRKLVEGSAGRNVAYGFSDKPGARGGNCYACHNIEPGKVGGNLGPSLVGYGKRWGITKENLNSPETVEKIKIIYSIIYNGWSMYPCSAMPRYGYHGVFGPNEIADIVAFLVHPDSPVNK